MELSRDYTEMVTKKYKSAIITPLLCAWELLSRPKNFTWKSDREELVKLAGTHNWFINAEMKSLIRNIGRTVIVITNTEQEIQFASQGFESMTGYKRSEIIGRKPNFLQGKDNDQEINKKIRLAIKSEMKFSAVVVNYRKDGSSYYCRLNIQPVYNKSKSLVHFLAVEEEVFM